MCVWVCHGLNSRFIGKPRTVGVLSDELSGRSSYHNEASGDRVIAAMAQLPKFGPVVLLAEEPAIFFIIPVGQRGAALTTPNRRGDRNGHKNN